MPKNCTAIACPKPSTAIHSCTLPHVPLPSQDPGMPLILRPAHGTNLCDAHSMLWGPGGLCSWLWTCNFLQRRGHLALKTFGIFSASDEVEFVAHSPHRYHRRNVHYVRQRHDSLEDIIDVKGIASTSSTNKFQ